ncbi:hypothetical protein HDU96_003424 [Phlyctochytrium bullatum]|nr:hypothetical protein HDU96_003424 [Phlyctochytrium bullatum]
MRSRTLSLTASSAAFYPEPKSALFAPSSPAPWRDLPSSIWLRPDPQPPQHLQCRCHGELATKCTAHVKMVLTVSPPCSVAAHMGQRSPYLLPSPSRDRAQFAMLEDQYCKDFVCCGISLENLHDLLQHIEENHAHAASDFEDIDCIDDDDDDLPIHFMDEDDVEMEDAAFGFGFSVQPQEEDPEMVYLRSQLAASLEAFKTSTNDSPQETPNPVLVAPVPRTPAAPTAGITVQDLFNASTSATPIVSRTASPFGGATPATPVRSGSTASTSALPYELPLIGRRSRPGASSTASPSMSRKGSASGLSATPASLLASGSVIAAPEAPSPHRLRDHHGAAAMHKVKLASEPPAAILPYNFDGPVQQIVSDGDSDMEEADEEERKRREKRKRKEQRKLEKAERKAAEAAKAAAAAAKQAAAEEQSSNRGRGLKRPRAASVERRDASPTPVRGMGLHLPPCPSAPQAPSMRASPAPSSGSSTPRRNSSMATATGYFETDAALTGFAPSAAAAAVPTPAPTPAAPATPAQAALSGPAAGVAASLLNAGPATVDQLFGPLVASLRSAMGFSAAAGGSRAGSPIPLSAANQSEADSIMAFLTGETTQPPPMLAAAGMQAPGASTFVSAAAPVPTAAAAQGKKKGAAARTLESPTSFASEGEEGEDGVNKDATTFAAPVVAAQTAGAVVADAGGDRPYRCKVEGCGKAYKNPGGLKYHVMHGHAEDTGDPEINNIIQKPYLCTVPDCGKRYKNLNGLKYHIEHAHADLLGVAGDMDY